MIEFIIENQDVILFGLGIFIYFIIFILLEKYTEDKPIHEYLPFIAMATLFIYLILVGFPVLFTVFLTFIALPIAFRWDFKRFKVSE